MLVIENLVKIFQGEKVKRSLGWTKGVHGEERTASGSTTTATSGTCRSSMLFRRPNGGELWLSFR